MVYLSELVVLLCTFYTLINAAPQSTIVKRTNPILGQAIDRNDPRRGGKLVPRPGKPATGAFSNVQQMIDDILFDGGVGIDSRSAIFSHYFNEGDRAKVKAVFAKLAGNPPDSGRHDPEGARELGQITIQGIDTPGGGDDKGCEQEGTIMYTDYYEGSGPVIVACEDAWVFEDRDDKKCNDMGDTLNDDMAILGTVVLHEFTHWDWFLRSITGGEMVDGHGPDGRINGYGLDNVYNNLDKKYAPLNPDSYAWYATEVLWSKLCRKNYKAPDDSDSDKVRVAQTKAKFKDMMSKKPPSRLRV